MLTARSVIVSSGKVYKDVRFPLLCLDEPFKGDETGRPRTALAHLYEPATNRTSIAKVDLQAKRLISLVPVPNVQPMVLQADYTVADALVRTNPSFVEAMRKRGITDMSAVHLEPWAPGFVGEARQNNARLMRIIPFLRGKSNNPYARPIEGVIALVDVQAKRFVSLMDTGVRAIAKEDGRYPQGPPSPVLKPLKTWLPAGSNAKIVGNQVAWQRWRFRFDLHPRDGLILRKLSYDGRSILYRASLSEMSVPYADPEPTWNWRAAFDVGEYGLGICATTLVPGRDVPDYATLLDAVIPGDDGRPRSAPKTIAIYERDGGLLWRHWDFVTNQTVSQRARELVISFIPAIGNYDYQVSYVLRTDGEISIESNLTGMMLAKGTDQTQEPTKGHSQPKPGHLVAPNVIATNHQHFFSFRLDFDVDGASNNTVMQEDTESISSQPGNAFAMVERPIDREDSRDMSLATGRKWRVVNPARRNRLGGATGYLILPGENAVPYGTRGNEARRAAGFTDRHLWVTKYRPGELYAAGDFPNQNPAPGGLPKYLNGEGTASEDVVVWLTMGITHIPRPEDWPIMPTHRTGFRMIPAGFFDRNPTLGG